jgi:mRNA interferase MazF
MKFSQWTVWLANLDPIVGSEQGRTRPVLIISKSSLNSILPVVNVIPITSRKAGRRIYPNEALMPADASGLTFESIALCYQIRTLDKNRLTRRLGMLSDQNVQRKLVSALRFQLGI